MKKLALLIAISGFFISSYSQNTFKDDILINAGIGISGVGIPIYAGFDYGIHENVTIGGEGNFRSHSSQGSTSIIGLSGNINYHINSAFQIQNNAWDIYLGATLSYYIWSYPNNFVGTSESGIGFNGQVGARYFFNPDWAVNLEFGGGSISGGKLGITRRL